jgi:hypothetical protein
MANTRYRKLVAVLIGIWFALSIAASAMNLYKNESDRPPLALGLAAITPILVFLAGTATSRDFRQFVLSLNARWLTIAQTWRIFGLIFIVLGAFHSVPLSFAIPAGVGDMVIGATAPFAARKLLNRSHTMGFVAWQVLGILDLIMAVSLGVASTLMTNTGPGMGLMTVLPLSLIPVFVVPLLFIFHLICVAQMQLAPGASALHA